jgi:hypothetical protein
MKAGLLFVACFLFVTSAMSQEAHQPTLDFSWKSIRGCRTLGDSPEFTIKNAPPGTARIRLRLSQGKTEKGGQEVDFPQSGIIPANSISTMGPCNPDMYRWTAIFYSRTGMVLGETFKNSFYPE